MAITAPLPRSDGHPWPMNRNPDPEVRERPTRRRFSASYQLAILDADAAAIVPGAKGALLRREGLSSSNVAEWRRLRPSDSYLLSGPVNVAPSPSARAVSRMIWRNE
jgi:hypothetical protein